MLSSPGIGSGLDVNAIVSQLMAVEQQPLVSLQSKKTGYDAKISDYGKVKSALAKIQASISTLKSTDSFSKVSASSSDSTLVTASVSTGAAEEVHTVEVTTLAKSHRLSSAVFTDENTVVGTGTLTVKNGSSAFVITIDSSNNTLAGIRDSINAASDNTGTTASIINIDGGSRLILTSDKTGVSNAIEVTVSGDGDGNDTDNVDGISRLVYQSAGTKNLSQLDAAVDSVIKVDGYTVTSATNEVSGVVSGITFSLKALGTATITSKNDYGTIDNAMSALSNDFNALRKTLTDARSGNLSGDNFLLAIERKMRDLFSEKVSGNINYANDLGFTFDKTGISSFDSTKLNALLVSDSNAVKDFFTKADTGFAVQFDSMLDSYLGVTGLIQSKTDGLTSSIESINQRIIDLDFRLGKTEERLLKQFSALDGLLSGLQSTSAFLTQQLSNLSSLTNNS